MNPTRLQQQLAFLREIDRLKSIVRQSPLIDGSRRENAAEHAWHLAMYAMLLADYAPTGMNSLRVLQMLLIHDIVEIDAGDHPLHGQADLAAQQEKEAAAAQRLFGMLPPDQGQALAALWQAFEHGESEEARFAKALDRLQPLLVNLYTGGGTWTENGVSYQQVLARYGPVIQRGAPALWAACEPLLQQHFSALPPA